MIASASRWKFAALRGPALALVQEADGCEAVAVEGALAGLRQQRHAGDPRLEGETIAVAGGLPADLAVAAQETAPDLVAQVTAGGSAVR